MKTSQLGMFPRARQIRIGSLTALLLALALLVGAGFLPAAAGSTHTTTIASMAQPGASPSLHWHELSASGTPSPRIDFGMAYDAAANYVVLFGGLVISGNLSSTFGNVTSQTWILQNGIWTMLNQSIAPAARSSMCLAYDVKDRYVLLFGGQSRTGNLQDTWIFSAGNWTNVTRAISPPAWVGPGACAYDPQLSSVVLYDPASMVGNETWAFSGGNWSHLHGVGSPSGTPPFTTVSASMAYDARDGYLVLVGGFNNSGLTSQTWIFSNRSWSLLPSSPGEHRRAGSGLAYDPAIKGLVMVGGYTYPFGKCQYESQNTLLFQNETWSRIKVGHPPGCVAPVVVYVPRAHGLVMFQGESGYDSATHKFTDALWVLR